MKQIYSTITAILLLLLLLPHDMFAGDINTLISEKYSKGKKTCPAVKEIINRVEIHGFDDRTITRTFIQTGHDACTVIRCAIEGEGNLEQIIVGALDVLTPPDVVAGCAIDAKASPEEISSIFDRGIVPELCYIPPMTTGDDLRIPEIDRIIIKRPNEYTSPSTFEPREPRKKFISPGLPD